jgi:hypothetical protein
MQDFARPDKVCENHDNGHGKIRSLTSYDKHGSMKCAASSVIQWSEIGLSLQRACGLSVCTVPVSGLCTANVLVSPAYLLYHGAYPLPIENLNFLSPMQTRGWPYNLLKERLFLDFQWSSWCHGAKRVLPSP